MARSTTPPTGAPEPGTRLSVTIERAAALGRGVAHVNGLTLLVARGVPGERIVAEVERTFPGYALARVVGVERAAPERVEPPCPHFAQCGGCDWQHVAYPSQLAFKRAVFEEQLARIGRLAPPADWELIAAESPLAYRDRLEFVPVPLHDRYAPGFHGAQGAAPVAIAHCRLAPERYTRLAAAVLDGLLAQGALPPPTQAAAAPLPLHRIAVQGTMREDGQSALAVLLHARPTRETGASNLRRRFLQAGHAMLPALRASFPELDALALCLPSGPGKRGRGAAGLEVLHGPPWLFKRVGNRTYRAPHDGFFQVHPGLAHRLCGDVVDAVRDALADGAHPSREAAVFDLYGGAGLYALPLAAAVDPRGLRVVCVDSDRAAVRAGEETARDSGLAHCAFQAGNLEQPGVFEALCGRWGAPAAVILDPPRRGLPAGLIDSLRSARPPLLVYVSCDGGTFARDAARLAPDYALCSLRGYDLFPQTHHLEVVGVFRPIRNQDNA